MLNNDLYKLMNTPSIKMVTNMYSNPITSLSLESIKHLQENIFSLKESHLALNAMNIYKQQTYLTDLYSNKFKESQYFTMQTSLKEMLNQQSSIASSMTDMFKNSQYLTMQTNLKEMFNQQSSIASSITDMFKNSQYLTMQTSLKEMFNQQSSIASSITDIFKNSQYLTMQTSLNEILNHQPSIASLVIDIFKDPQYIATQTHLKEILDHIDNDQQIQIISDVNHMINSGIISQGHFTLLSESYKKALMYFINYIFVPFLISCFATYAMENREQIQTVLFKATTKNEVNSTLRSSQIILHQQFLKDHRVVIVERLHLREFPNTNSDILEELRIGQLLKVIDKSQRSWLFVEVEINGNI